MSSDWSPASIVLKRSLRNEKNPTEGNGLFGFFRKALSEGLGAGCRVCLRGWRFWEEGSGASVNSPTRCWRAKHRASTNDGSWRCARPPITRIPSVPIGSRKWVAISRFWVEWCASPAYLGGCRLSAPAAQAARRPVGLSVDSDRDGGEHHAQTGIRSTTP